MRKPFVVLAAATLTLTGCMSQDAAVAEEDIERWQAAADESLPGASHVTVEIDEVTCYVACGEDILVNAEFATYQDMMQHEDDLVALRELITTDEPDLRVTFRLRSNDAEAAADSASETISAAVGEGLAAAAVYVDVPILFESGVSIPAHLRLFVDDPTAITPELLSQTMETASATLDDLGASVETIYFSTPDGMGLRGGAPGYAETIIEHRELDQLTASATHDCVTQGGWAFDLSGDSVVPSPGDAPQGACA